MRPRRSYNGTMQLSGLPGGDLVEQGLCDLSEGRETAAALLVAIGASRLCRLGFDVPTLASPEHRLYELLARDDPDDAHARYNALIPVARPFRAAVGVQNAQSL